MIFEREKLRTRSTPDTYIDDVVFWIFKDRRESSGEMIFISKVFDMQIAIEEVDMYDLSVCLRFVDICRGAETQRTCQLLFLFLVI